MFGFFHPFMYGPPSMEMMVVRKHINQVGLDLEKQLQAESKVMRDFAVFCESELDKRIQQIDEQMVEVAKTCDEFKEFERKAKALIKSFEALGCTTENSSITVNPSSCGFISASVSFRIKGRDGHIRVDNNSADPRLWATFKVEALSHLLSQRAVYLETRDEICGVRMEAKNSIWRQVERVEHRTYDLMCEKLQAKWREQNFSDEDLAEIAEQVRKEVDEWKAPAQDKPEGDQTESQPLLEATSEAMNEEEK
jgi:hypothetical protein